MKQIKKTILILTTILTLITGCSDTSTATASTINVSKTPTAANKKITPLVSAQWLHEHLNDPNLILLDASVLVKMDKTGYQSISGKDEYIKAHIPNARFADLMGALSVQETEQEFILPSSEKFQNAIRELGVKNSSHVVIYAIENQSWPTRVWWMLRWGGFDRVSILNGGQTAWTNAGYSLTSEISQYERGDFDFKLREGVVVDKHFVAKAITNEKVTIVDSLPPAHYKGDFAMYTRKGHITSAINLPSSNFVDASGHFLSKDDLELMLDEKRKNKMVTYCGGGIAASSVAFNLHRAGYSDVAVYMGSLQEWTEDSDNPMSIGEAP